MQELEEQETLETETVEQDPLELELEQSQKNNNSLRDKVASLQQRLKAAPSVSLEFIEKAHELGIPDWAFSLSPADWNKLEKRAPQTVITDIKRFMNTNNWSEAKKLWDRYVTGPEPNFRPRKRKGKGNRRRRGKRGGKGKGNSPRPTPS
jgi:hypothetical protein